ncbi:hypothetical protein TNCV_2810911 [Trichonephila clavipes]|nr:hypothetical protein TNCV_2810911 [Trichonephila clavipes]
MLQNRSSPSYNAECGPAFGSYCQKKQTEHSIRPFSSALFSYRYDSYKADRVLMLRKTLVYMLVGLSDVFHLPQLTVACD